MAQSGSLLKSIVVVGASLTSGCGGIVSTSTDVDRSTDAAAGSGSLQHGSGGRAGQFGAGGTPAGTAPSTIVMGGAPAATGSELHPLVASDCGATQRFKCDCNGTGPFTTYCLPTTNPGIDLTCRCDPSAPLVPTDCPHTEQFTCVDWGGAGTSCSCDPSAPLQFTDCEPGKTYEQCHSYDPPVGCSCICCMIR